MPEGIRENNTDQINRTPCVQAATARNALRESEAVLNGIIDNAAEAICLLDTEGRELWCNPSFVHLMPAPVCESERARFSDRLHPSDMPAFFIAIERARSTGRSGTFECRTLDRSGSIRHFETNICVVNQTNGHPGRFITIARDVTGRKQAEHSRTMTRILLDEAQCLESIGRIASGIAHEINTPIQFVGDNLRFLKSSFIELVDLVDNVEHFVRAVESSGHFSPQVADLRAAIAACDLEYARTEIPVSLDQSIEGIQRVARIVHAMRDFSHPDKPDKAPADLNRSIESTAIVARNEWKYVCELKLDLDPDMGKVVCSISELNQVFLNLIVNAAHAIAEKIGASASGKGTISITTKRTGTHAEIRVQDTGSGIAPEIQPHLFEAFFTTKPAGKGTGQGLAIARSVVVDRHGGEITYETIQGSGTCFIVRIPLRLKEAAAAA
ncbi:MAG: sensor histidine kinase [Opitutaceae bacterium]